MALKEPGTPQRRSKKISPNIEVICTYLRIRTITGVQVICQTFFNISRLVISCSVSSTNQKKSRNIQKKPAKSVELLFQCVSSNKYKRMIFVGQDSIILYCCQKINGLKKKHWQHLLRN